MSEDRPSYDCYPEPRIYQRDLVEAREAVLDRAVGALAEHPGVIGIVLAGSLASDSSDAYSDIDLRAITTPEAHADLVGARLSAPASWGELLFNEWSEGGTRCVSHFRPFLKADVFYINVNDFHPSPWLRFPATILLDRTGVVRDVLNRSRDLPFDPPPDSEVSRILSKGLAAAHEVVRRVR
jgi:predicted nucleotidyltransferase